MVEFYTNYNADIDSNLNIAASHAVVSDHVGTPCGESDHELYIQNCDVDSVYDMLNHVHGGTLAPPLTPGSMSGNLVEFDQNEFFGNNANGASMADIGYFYMPANCNDGTRTCKLHIFFHGCEMGAEIIGTDFMTTAGFIEIADANDMVILFPMIHAKAINTGGCWNWFGYLNDLFGADYAKKNAEQMLGMYQMLQRAAGI